jgi:hypothetical protein
LWLNNKKLSEWNGRADSDVFNYDLNAGDKVRYTEGTLSRAEKPNSDHRRDLACTQRWKDEKKECPESNQPAVEPGPWPYTNLETIDPVAKFEIEAMRFPDEDQPSRSGRVYSCDEFPPASWIEGGVGMENCTLRSLRKLYCIPADSTSRCSGRGWPAWHDFLCSYRKHLHEEKEEVRRTESSCKETTLGQDCE